MLFQTCEILTVETVGCVCSGGGAGTDGGLLCCAGGTGHIRFEDRVIPMERQNRLLLYCGRPFALYFQTPPESACWVRVKINYVDLHQAVAGKVLQLPYSDNLLRCAVQAAGGDAGALAMLGQAAELLLTGAAGRETRTGAETAPACTGRQLLLARLSNYIETHLQNSFSVPELALAAGCSSRQLNRALQDACGCTAMGFVSRERIRQAERLLRFSDLSVTEIAYSVGYSSIHYFSRVFKKLEGVCPQTFRASLFLQPGAVQKGVPQ